MLKSAFLLLKTCLLVVLIFLQCSYINAQSIRGTELVANLENYVGSYPQEKIFIHHDRPYYALGDQIWYKVYLVDARTHLQETPSSLITVELINPFDSIVSQQFIKLTPGQDFGDISIESDWDPGSYELRAYSSYQRNYNADFIFTKSIMIHGKGGNNKEQKLSAKNQPTLRFYPEGGGLVEGLNSIVAFEAAIGTQGIDMAGVIENGSGDTIARLESKHNGMGYFAFTPAPDEEYTAIITHDSKDYNFPMPGAKKEGYVMTVKNRSKDFFSVEVTSSEKKPLKDCFIIAHVRGIPILVIDNMEGHEYLAKVPKKGMGSGIIHLTLFDKKSSPQCERLIFVASKEDGLDTKITPANSYFTKKQKAKVSVSVNSIEGAGIASNLSLSIIDKAVTQLDGYASNMESYLLLESDIAQSITQPYYYLQGKAANTFFLDLLLLTKGWRRFKWDEIVDMKEPDIKYAPEAGFAISGVITEKGKPKKPIKAEVFLSISGGTFEMLQTTTGDDGRFSFVELPIVDTSVVIMQANKFKDRKKKKKGSGIGPKGNRNVDILLDTLHSSMAIKKRTFVDQENDYDATELVSITQEKIDFIKSQGINMSVDLEEVTIKGKKKSENEELGISQPLYSDPDNRLILDSIRGINGSQTVFDLIRTRIPGAQVIGTPRVNQTVRFRGIQSIQLNSTAGFLVDGIQVSQTYVNTLTVDQVKVIDVIKGLSKTSVYGEFGAGGIVAIYLNNGPSRRQQIRSVNGIINMQHEGYYAAREFYMPDYKLHPTNQGVPDIRPTLYWDPSILTNDGSADITFYCADKASQYSIILQGVTFDGRPVFKTYDFEVK